MSDSYLRTFDDLIVIKTPQKGLGPARDITVKHCVLANEFAHALSIGQEITEPVEHAVFSDCDVIGDKGREWVLGVSNYDSGRVRDVTFENIRIEQARRLITLELGAGPWNPHAERGHIENVIFRNISSREPEVPRSFVNLIALDAAHGIHHVLLDHVTMASRPLKRTDIVFNPAAEDVIGDVKVTP